MLNPPDEILIEKLKSVCGEGAWLHPQEAPRYFEDPRDRFVGKASLILLPDTTAKVAEIVTLCAHARVGVLPYGGGTGAVAGHISPDNDAVIVVSLERMNRIREASLEDDAITVEAGCVLADIRQKAEELGRLFPLSMGSEGSCRIGGNLATNAGGIQVLRYGNTRDLCLGIEAVLPDGSILNDLRPLRKDNTGYNLRHLLIGSEGTLGIITAATLKLLPAQAETATAMCVISRPAEAVTLLQLLRSHVGEALSACELMCRFGIELMARHFPDQRYPFSEPHEWFAIIEASGSVGIRQKLEQALEQGFEQDLVKDAVMAESEAQRRAIWNLREMTPEANRLEGAICNSDTSVPISRIDDFIAATDAAIADLHPGMRVNCYGHIGDGNIHYNVFPPQDIPKLQFIDQHPEIREATRMAINETTHACNGSISAEHGIGRLKPEDLTRYGDPTKLNLMRIIKEALDPKGIMNPGAIFAKD